MSPCYVEFEPANDEQFSKLARVVDALRAAKTTDDWKDDSYWLSFFDDTARGYFWWPSVAETEEFKRWWDSTGLEERWSDPRIRRWLFPSLITSFRNGEYELLGCRRVSERTAHFEFKPHSGPYGGTACMRALIEAFAHRVVRVKG